MPTSEGALCCGNAAAACAMPCVRKPSGTAAEGQCMPLHRDICITAAFSCQPQHDL